mgnify:CR=1 FL=1
MSNAKYENSPLEYWKDKSRDIKRETTKAIRKGLKKELISIRNKARKNLKSGVNNSNTINPKYSDTLLQGIRIIGPKNDKKYKSTISGCVSIMSNRKKGSGSFRLIFLEGGTSNRRSRKNQRYLGDIKPRRFFKSAHSGSEESNAIKNISEEMDKALKKL